MSCPAAFTIPRAKLRLRIHHIELGKQRNDATQMVGRPRQDLKRLQKSRVRIRPEHRISIGVEQLAQGGFRIPQAFLHRVQEMDRRGLCEQGQMAGE